MSGRRRPGRDRGAFTAELAAGLPALMLLLFAGLTAVSAVTAQGRCVDAARDAALAAARGDPGPVPDDTAIHVEVDGEEVTARATTQVRLLGSHLPLLTVTGTATAAREPSAIAP